MAELQQQHSQKYRATFALKLPPAALNSNSQENTKPNMNLVLIDFSEAISYNEGSVSQKSPNLAWSPTAWVEEGGLQYVWDQPEQTLHFRHRRMLVHHACRQAQLEEVSTFYLIS